MYAEIGASSSDTATVTMTYGGTTSKQFNIFVQQIECSAEWRLAFKQQCTECPKIYRKSVLHLLKYTANLYLSRCSTDLRYILRHSVVYLLPDSEA